MRNKTIGRIGVSSGSCLQTADVTFDYDALGRRVARTEGSTAVVYFQADQQTIADYPRGGAASTATYRYVFASYVDEPVVRKTTGSSGTVLYYHRNQQYSIYALTDSSGTVSERYAYTPYGQPTFLNASASVQTSSAAGNRYTYTAREWDATLGLHHFRARWMSGLTGRFLTRDPIGYRGGQDLYADYFGLNYLDPTGTAKIDCTCNCRKSRCRDIEGYNYNFGKTVNCSTIAGICCDKVIDDFRGNDPEIIRSSCSCIWNVSGAGPDVEPTGLDCSRSACRWDCDIGAASCIILCRGNPFCVWFCITREAGCMIGCQGCRIP